MNILVGNTGFVGSNICEQKEFDKVYNSKNIKEAFGTNPELLVYSGVPAQKFLANKFPEEDFKVIQNAIHNIKKINPQKIVLISTIDIYKNPINVDEDKKIDTAGLQAYGKNRYYLEEWVQKNFNDYLIVHLPGLYGKNIKKNYIYDLIHIIPSMLTKEKYEEIIKEKKEIEQFYKIQENGFYKYIETNKEEENKLKQIFLQIGFSALNFTDSRAYYQFYNLSYLWEHICKAMENNIKILNLAVEPIKIEELYKYITGKEFENHILEKPPIYNFKTKHYKIFNGENGYIFNKQFILKDIKNFVEKQSQI